MKAGRQGRREGGRERRKGREEGRREEGNGPEGSVLLAVEFLNVLQVKLTRKMSWRKC